MTPTSAAAAPHVVIVGGGGPTGVELAGSQSEIGGLTVARDFRNFEPRRPRVHAV